MGGIADHDDWFFKTKTYVFYTYQHNPMDEVLHCFTTLPCYVFCILKTNSFTLFILDTIARAKKQIEASG